LSNASIVASLAVGGPSVIVAAASYVFATRAHRETARVENMKVDAAAFDRAKMIYEGAIATLQSEVANLKTEVRDLHAEIAGLRSANKLIAAATAQREDATAQRMTDQGDSLTEDREHAIRRSHLEHRCANHPAPICTYDRTSWPCDVHVLLAALDGARAACIDLNVPGEGAG
jgi:predicted RNase H-like nuclease (RuvC/YqgF family)